MKQAQAAFYLRVSTTTQDYKRQLEELQERATADGYSKIDIYKEKMSGTKTEERLEYQSLLSKIEANPKLYGCVYVWEISRLGRNGKEIRNFVEKLAALKVNIYIKNKSLYTLDEKGMLTMTTTIILTVLSEMAEMELETIRERSISGKLSAVGMGKQASGGNNFAYGFRKDGEGKNGYLVVDEKEAEVIKDIFKLYKEGNGFNVISKILNQRGIQTRRSKINKGKGIDESYKWMDAHINDILKNPIYKGQRRYSGRLFEIKAIVSPEDFDECTRIRETKTHRNFTTTYTYLLKDLMVCGVCGRNFFAVYKPKQKYGVKYYACSSILGNYKRCSNCTINIDLIESILYKELLNSNLIHKYLDNSKNIKEEIKAEIIRLNNQVAIDQTSIKEKKQENTRLLNLYQAGGIKDVDDFITRQNKIETSTKTIQDRIQLNKTEIASKNDLLRRLNDIKANKKILEQAKGDRDNLRTIFKQIFNKIVVTKVGEGLVYLKVYFLLNSNTLSLNYLIDMSDYKKKVKNYRYKAIRILDCNPLFKNNILLSEPSEIADEFINRVDKTYIKGKVIETTNWIPIDEDEMIHI